MSDPTENLQPHTRPITLLKLIPGIGAALLVMDLFISNYMADHGLIKTNWQLYDALDIGVPVSLLIILAGVVLGWPLSWYLNRKSLPEVRRNPLSIKIFYLVVILIGLIYIARSLLEWMAWS